MASHPSIAELIDDFELLGDWESRFTHLIDLGRKLPPMPPAEMTEANRVHGCQATVYMMDHTSGRGAPARIDFNATANAHIVNGLIAILRMIYIGRTPTEALAIDPEPIFAKLGLNEHLSPTRRNGLHAMLTRIRAIAASHLS